jgi:hypothetical protein
MKIKTGFIFLMLCWLLAAVFPPAAHAGPEVAFSTPGVRLTVLSQAEFDARLGHDPKIPGTDEEVLGLAQRLFSDRGTERLAAAPEEGLGCSTPEVERLFAALRSPAIADVTRAMVDRLLTDEMPPLPKTLTYGNFRLHYTDSDPDTDHNVTRAEVKATAVALQGQWDKYAANFKKPLHYVSEGREWVDVNIFFWGDAHYGVTSSAWDYINLSSKNTVKDPCRRRTVSAHELFHRVFFNYGLDSAVLGDWLVEGVAVWAQKYCHSGLKDYMSTMNFGLLFPDRDFLTVRGYDACHFWIYLDERAGWEAIRDVLATCEANGRNVGAAMDEVLQARLKMSFEQFIRYWTRANCLKDVDNARAYDYREDEVRKENCGTFYGPLSHVSRTRGGVSGGGVPLSYQGDVKPYGADYYEFTLEPDLTSLVMRVKGAKPGNFFYQVIGMKDNKWRKIVTSGKRGATFSFSLTTGQWDKAALIVGGGPQGGAYTVEVGP